MEKTFENPTMKEGLVALPEDMLLVSQLEPFKKMVRDIDVDMNAIFGGLNVSIKKQI
jgi:hypothetical protein